MHEDFVQAFDLDSYRAATYAMIELGLQASLELDMETCLFMKTS
jgi:hypothetical protein